MRNILCTMLKGMSKDRTNPRALDVSIPGLVFSCNAVATYSTDVEAIHSFPVKDFTSKQPLSSIFSIIFFRYLRRHQYYLLMHFELFFSCHTLFFFRTFTSNLKSFWQVLLFFLQHFESGILTIIDLYVLAD